MKQVIYIILYLYIPSMFMFASNSDHILFRFENSTIEFMWQPDVQELNDITNGWDFLNLIGNNYEAINKSDNSIFAIAYMKNEKYTLNISINNDDGELTLSDSFPEMLNVLIFACQKLYKIKLDHSSSIICYSVLKRLSEDEKKYNDILNQVYFGAAPGIMEYSIGNLKFYQYLFFNQQSALNLKKKIGNYCLVHEITKANMNQILQF